MRATLFTLAAVAAGLASSGAARAGSNGVGEAAGLREAGPAPYSARLQLAQYGGGYGGYGGGYGYGGGMRYCESWAQGMVAMGVEAARKGCLQYGPQGLHTNFDAHMDFCLRSSPGRTQRFAARANALLASCNR